MARNTPILPNKPSIFDLATLSVLANRDLTWPKLARYVRACLAPELAPATEVLATRLERMVQRREVLLSNTGETIRLLDPGRARLRDLTLLPLMTFGHEL
ncbi:MAG: hypothetical protein AAFY56_01615, partial [Pseudomonadota bacterium]